MVAVIQGDMSVGDESTYKISIIVYTNFVLFSTGKQLFNIFI